MHPFSGFFGKKLPLNLENSYTPLNVKTIGLLLAFRVDLLNLTPMSVVRARNASRLSLELHIASSDARLNLWPIWQVVNSQTKCITGYVRDRHGTEIQPPQP